jgi:hypothetical protein
MIRRSVSCSHCHTINSLDNPRTTRARSTARTAGTVPTCRGRSATARSAQPRPNSDGSKPSMIARSCSVLQRFEAAGGDLNKVLNREDQQ